MVAHICIYSIQGSEAEGSQVPIQPSYIVRLILKKEKKSLRESKMTHKDLHDAILRKIQNSRTDDQGRGRKIKTVLSQAANRKGGFKE